MRSWTEVLLTMNGFPGWVGGCGKYASQSASWDAN